MLLCLCDTYIWFNSYIWYLYMILYCTITKVTWRSTNLLVRDNQCLFMHPCVALDLNEHTGVKILGFYIISLCKSVHVWRGEGGQTVKFDQWCTKASRNSRSSEKFHGRNESVTFLTYEERGQSSGIFFPLQWREGRSSTWWEHLNHVEELGKEQNVNQRLHDARDTPFLACTGPDGKRRQGSQNWRPPGTGLVL